MLYPYIYFRFYWDLISLAFLIVTMVVIPVGIAFFNEAMTTVAGWMFFNLRKVTTNHFRPDRKILDSTLTKYIYFLQSKWLQ